LKRIIEKISKDVTGKSFLYKRLIKSKESEGETLENVITNFLSKAIPDFSFERLDHRFEDIIIPGFNSTHFQLENIWIVIDVSGSMRERDLSNFYSKLEKVFLRFPSVDVQISFFSNILTSPFKIQSAADLETAFSQVDTTGGTEFSVIFEDYDEIFPHQKPLANIIFTDGYGNAPNASLDPGNPTWWVLTQSSKFSPEFGEVIVLEEKSDD